MGTIDPLRIISFDKLIFQTRFHSDLPFADKTRIWASALLDQTNRSTLYFVAKPGMALIHAPADPLSRRSRVMPTYSAPSGLLASR